MGFRSFALLLTLALINVTAPVYAFCRESLASQSQGPCKDDPSALPLFWVVLPLTVGSRRSEEDDEVGLSGRP